MDRDEVEIVVVGGAVVPDEGSGDKSFTPKASTHSVEVVGRHLQAAVEQSLDGSLAAPAATLKMYTPRSTRILAEASKISSQVCNRTS